MDYQFKKEKSKSSETSSHNGNHNIRRIQERMGRDIFQCTNKEKAKNPRGVDIKGKYGTNKCPGVKRSSICRPSPRRKCQDDRNKDKNGQHLCNSSNKKNGELKKLNNEQNCSRAMDLGRIQKEHTYTKPPSWQRELGGRPTVQNNPRLIRLEVANSNIPENKFQNGAPSCGFVCQSVECPTQEVLLVESTTSGIGDRCIESQMANVGSLRISSNSIDTCSSEQSNSGGNREDCADNTSMDNSKLVCKNLEPDNSRTHHSTKDFASTYKLTRRSAPTSKTEELSPSRLDIVRQSYQKMGFSAEVSKFMSNVHRDNTIKAYDSTWRRWTSWCNINRIDKISPTLNDIANFLLYLYNKGLEASSIAQCRSALSSSLPSINGQRIGQNPAICALIKGFEKKRPKQAKMAQSWSVDGVLRMIEGWEDNWNLTPQKLTWKLAMLLALTASSRVSELTYLDCRLMTNLPEGICFQHISHKKNTPSNKTPAKSYFPRFYENRKLCPCLCIETYIARTAKIRDSEENPLLRSYIKPYNKVSPTTISRWITSCIKEAGYEVKPHQKMGHSARGKSSSKAFLQGIPLLEILKAGDWKAKSTNAKHYFKPDFNSAYATKILSNALNH